MKKQRVSALLFFLWGSWAAWAVEAEGGWGVNGRVSLLSAPDLEQRLSLLRDSGVKWLREDYRFDEPSHSLQSRNLDVARKKGFRILALIPYGVDKPPLAPENQLCEDLGEVFRQAEKWAGENRGRVDAWELYNEPDIGFCRDLPDRSTAYMKAVYLGLKSGGGPGRIPVLMGAVALPPGPWLERAARNGLLDYADAYNFHYYGHAEDLAEVVHSHRRFLKHQEARAPWRDSPLEAMPLWMTECGYPAGREPRQRQLQADYLRKTSEIAWMEKVASFMPFALRAANRLSLVSAKGKPYPAWDDFARWSKARSLPGKPAFLWSGNAGQVVLQWLPKPGQALPHKPSGTYRFLTGRGGNGRLPMEGEIRIYNFGEEPVFGVLKAEGLRSIRMKAGEGNRTEIPAGGMISVPLVFTAPAAGYFMEWCSVHFELERNDWKKPGMAARSGLFFGLETPLKSDDFIPEKIPFSVLAGDPRFHYIDPGTGYAISSRSSPWIGLNGLQISPAEKGGWNLAFKGANAEGSPPMAVARVNGLPWGSFLRLRSDRAFGGDFSVRVDLVDVKGQRFTIFENMGMSYFEIKNEVWLNLKDFHLYFWGASRDEYFDPSAVREIQVRPYFKAQGATLDLELMAPRFTLPQ